MILNMVHNKAMGLQEGRQARKILLQEVPQMRQNFSLLRSNTSKKTPLVILWEIPRHKSLIFLQLVDQVVNSSTSLG